jgi:hypothetical protein
VQNGIQDIIAQIAKVVLSDSYLTDKGGNTMVSSTQEEETKFALGNYFLYDFLSSIFASQPI